MTSPTDPLDTYPEPTNTVSQTENDDKSFPSDRRIRERARDQLKRALDADASAEKNYHIRTALQTLVLAEESPAG